MYRNLVLGVHHTHAYTNSIVNAATFNAYSNSNCSIYGHYGIIYMPFVKLFGNNIISVAITIAFFTFLLYVSAFYVANKLIKNDLYFGLTVVAIASASTVNYGGPFGVYIQGMPHRVLFPMLAIGFVVLLCNNKRLSTRKIFILESIFGTLAITFNLESGLSAAAAIASYHIFEKCGSTNDKIIRVAKYLGYCILCFVASYVFVNIYNLICLGNWIGLKIFIYPLTSEEYNIDTILRVPLPVMFGKFTMYLMVFIYTGINTAYHLWSEDMDSSKRQSKLICLAIAVSALGPMCYVINRMPASFAEPQNQFILLVSFYAQQFINVKDKTLKTIYKKPDRLFNISLSAVMFVLVSLFALEGIMGAGWTIRNRMGNNWNVASLKRSVQTFKEKIPEDTLAFGKGMPELYFQLGWNPQIAVTDWADPNHYSIDKVEQAINEYDSFVMMDGTPVNIPDGFVPVEEISTEDFKCIYYKRLN